MMPVSADTMKKLDSMALTKGLSTLYLMEKAGEAVAKKTIELISKFKGGRISIFCGKGNNGGDGFVAARKLTESGFDVRVYLLGKQDEVKNEAAVNLLAFKDAGGTIKEIDTDSAVERLKNKLNDTLIIDAILGTGFSGSVSGHLKELIELLNSSNIPILSVDVPSGLDATTGKASPVAIKAKWTISFALPKKGFYKKDGPNYAGSIKIVNIGFPKELLKKAVRL